MFFFFFFKQKTAYEMRISDWSSDVCSSDLPALLALQPAPFGDVADVLLEGAGEGVAAGAVGDEEQVAALGRVEHGGDRGAARIADRARRQSRVHIGIVREIDLKIGRAHV